MKRLLLVGAALVMAPFAQAGEINITFSEELNEKIEEDYGNREREYLLEELTEDLERSFGDQLDLVGAVNVTIVDARPNRPTFEQMSHGGLSFESISIGGADLNAVVYSASGELLTSYEYDYYTHSITDVVGMSTWTDARRAFDRFARRLAVRAEDALTDDVS